MTNYGMLFPDKLTDWLLEAGFIEYQFQMSIYYKYAPDGSNCFVLSHVDNCVYWYTSEALGKWFMDTLVKNIPCKLLGICTLVDFNQNLYDEGSFHFCGSG